MDPASPFKLPLISGLTTCAGPHVGRCAKGSAPLHAGDTLHEVQSHLSNESSSPSSPDHGQSTDSPFLRGPSPQWDSDLFSLHTPAESVQEALSTPAALVVAQSTSLGNTAAPHEPECESLAFVRAVIVYGLESVSQASSSSSSSIKGARPETAHQFLTAFSFKGTTISAPLASLPRNASVKGHEWALRDVRTCILGAVESLPESARPTCFLRHAWRANFTACLRVLCSADPAIRAAASNHGWQLFPKGFSRGDKYLVLKEKRRNCLQQRTAAAAAAAANAATTTAPGTIVPSFPQAYQMRGRATSSGADSAGSLASIYAVPQAGAYKYSSQDQHGHSAHSARIAASVYDTALAKSNTASNSPTCTGDSSSSEEPMVPRQDSLPVHAPLAPLDMLDSMVEVPSDRAASLRTAAVLHPSVASGQQRSSHGVSSGTTPSPPCVPQDSELGSSPATAAQASLPDLWMGGTTVPSDGVLVCGSTQWTGHGGAGTPWLQVQSLPHNGFPASLLSAYPGYPGWPMGLDASTFADLAALSGADLFDPGVSYQASIADDWTA